MISIPMADKLSFIKDLIVSCSVPKLTVDIDNTPIDSSQFDEYRKLLEVQLPILFDFIQQNDGWLSTKEDNHGIIEVKGQLIMLACEITAHNTLYKIRNERFLEVLEGFMQTNLHNLIDGDARVEEYILNRYTEYLKGDAWKRHIGAVHGFNRLLELKASIGHRLPLNWMNFSLSLGLTLRETHLPRYKELSTTLFQIIISHSDPKELKALNIPDVIFDALRKSVRTVDTVDGATAAWRCLCDCLDFNEDTDSWDWDTTDEVMETLLSSLKYTSDSELVVCLLSFIPRILLRFSTNRKEIEGFLTRDYNSLRDEDFVAFRHECTKISTCASYRWALYILKLFLTEQQKFLASPALCEKMLERFHVIYLSTIYIISVEIININLLKFFEQFPNVLMEALAAHGVSKGLKQHIRQIYITFIDQLEKSDLEDVTSDFQQYHKAFKRFVAEQCC